MKKSAHTKHVLLSLAATSALWSSFAVAGIEITPSVDISNMYLYRGEDLGDGNAQISGGLQGTLDNVYAGVWGTSASSGEYDLYAGANYEFAKNLTVDMSVWTYTYPHDETTDTFGNYTEVFVTVSYDMDDKTNVWFSIVDNVASDYGSNERAASTGSYLRGDDGYFYYALGASYEKFSATLGFADPETDRYQLSNDPADVNYAGNAASVDYTHLDLTYAYNEQLKFTASKIIQQDDFKLGGVKYENLREDDTLFQVVYSVPFE